MFLLIVVRPIVCSTHLYRDFDKIATQLGGHHTFQGVVPKVWTASSATARRAPLSVVCSSTRYDQVKVTPILINSCSCSLLLFAPFLLHFHNLDSKTHFLPISFILTIVLHSRLVPSLHLSLDKQYPFTKARPGFTGRLCRHYTNASVKRGTLSQTRNVVSYDTMCPVPDERSDDGLGIEARLDERP